MDNSETIQNEIEQNANIVYNETREFVSEMQPSLTAAAIAYDMLNREVVGELVMADWSEKERAILEPYVWVIVNGKFMEAFEAVIRDCEDLRRPALLPDSTIILMEQQKPH